jgi:hypothetical protein
MRNEGEIRQKLKQVLFRHRSRLLKANFKKLPETCDHNAVIDLGDQVHIRMCVYPVEDGPRAVLCDERLAGLKQARKCDLWEPVRTKDEIKTEFQEMFKDTSDLGPVAAEYPDAAALLWVLGEGVIPEEVPEEPEEPPTKRWDWRRWPWSPGGGK